MIPIRLAELAAVTGGTLHQARGDELISGAVEFDSRALRPGGLFIALPGERTDGHDFAAAAVRAGAAAVLAARPVDAPAVVVPPAGGLATGSYLAATDPDGSGAAVLAALGRLAGHVVQRLPALTVVGVTGSSGKTSTKDLLAAVLAALGPTVAPPGSFNNELGHPWTVLRADEHTRHLVLELSARGAGHIAALCRIAPPRMGVVLNVGRAHLGEFGSIDAVAAAKGELVEALPPAAPAGRPAGQPGGVAVLNADDPRVLAMASRTAAKVVTVGVDPPPAGADVPVRATDVVLDAGGRPAFRLDTPHGSTEVALRLVGAHHVPNALAAAAVGLELGGTPEQVAAALGAASPASRWRMESTDRPDGVTVINDAYNANPESMAAALRALAAIGVARRRWAVLGEMAELGPASTRAHGEIAALVAELGVHRLLAVGTSRYGPAAEVVADVDTAIDLLRAELEPGDVVLVKASRAVGLDRVAAGVLTPDAVEAQR